MKRPFDIDLALSLIREAVEPFPKAALFEIVEKGFSSPFQILVSCIISIRTRDEVTMPTALKLFEIAESPSAMASLTPEAIDRAIGACAFHEAKSLQIHQIASRVASQYQGDLPCDFDTLVSFRGVGPKCANLVLGIVCNQPRIGVDIHVHRVTNRWGYVQEKTPEQTMGALEATLPIRYRVEINRLLVPFGKHICTGALPRCSTCPVLDMCKQVGVKRHR